MSARLRQEDRGSTLIVAVILIGVMMGLGLATASYVDGEQAQSGRERVRESAFNIAESALDAQVFQLARTWPPPTATPSAPCTSSSAASLSCPDIASLQASAATADYSSSACATGTATPLWTTSVHDDGFVGSPAIDYYNAQLVGAQPTYDANGNGRLWVRASGTARCIQRTLVTMVNQEPVTLGFPRNVLTANWFRVNSNGKKTMIDTQGLSLKPPAKQAAQPADLVVRCDAAAPSPCRNYSAAKGQVTPDTSKESPTTFPTAVSPADLAAFKSLALASKPPTYYPAGTCPASLTGAAVYVEDISPCTIPPGGNSAAVPGSLYIGRGTLSFGGNSRFYGLVYMGNLQRSPGAVVTLTGNARIQGAVAVDWEGGVSVGSSGNNLIFDPRVFDAFKGNRTVGRTPDTWRELPSGQ